jgi:hypothetical protein
MKSSPTTCGWAVDRTHGSTSYQIVRKKGHPVRCWMVSIDWSHSGHLGGCCRPCHTSRSTVQQRSWQASQMKNWSWHYPPPPLEKGVVASLGGVLRVSHPAPNQGVRIHHELNFVDSNLDLIFIVQIPYADLLLKWWYNQKVSWAPEYQWSFYIFFKSIFTKFQKNWKQFWTSSIIYPTRMKNRNAKFFPWWAT